MNTRPLLSLSLQAVLFSSLHAGSVNWDGGGNTNDFNDEDNWSGNSLPDDKDEAIFNNFVVSPVLSQTIEIKQLEIKGTSTVTLNTGTFTLKVKDDKDSVKVSSNSSLTFSGNLLATGKKLDLKIDGNAAFGGSIDGDGEKIEIDGNGITTFSSTTVSNFDSLTVKKNAELALDGSTINGAVKVKGGVLSGSGDLVGDLDVDNDKQEIGILSPGNTGAGTITVTGDVSGEGTWIFDVVDSSTRDLITVGNDLDISGFTLDLSGSPTTSGTAVIATYGGNLTEASGGGFNSVIGLNGRQISYNGGQITITGAAIIPEVTNIIPLSLAFVPLLGMRKRRLRK